MAEPCSVPAMDAAVGPRTTVSSLPNHPSIKIVEEFLLLSSTSQTRPCSVWCTTASCPSGNAGGELSEPGSMAAPRASPCLLPPSPGAAQRGTPLPSLGGPGHPPEQRWRPAARPARAASATPGAPRARAPPPRMRCSWAVPARTLPAGGVLRRGDGSAASFGGRPCPGTPASGSSRAWSMPG